jgi:hypothetical protein
MVIFAKVDLLLSGLHPAEGFGDRIHSRARYLETGAGKFDFVGLALHICGSQAQTAVSF